jgi:hypothetical protein
VAEARPLRLVGHTFVVTTDTAEREDLYVPDRFEQLRDSGTGSLRTIILPVEASLEEIDVRFADLRAARRGGLAVFRGAPGAGKSTFLDTLGQFREGVKTERIVQNADVAAALSALPASNGPRLVVVEGREALLDVSEAALETSMHAINTFVRSAAGQQTLVVWPTNTDELTNALVSLGMRIGGVALLGNAPHFTVFSGPARSEYVQIAERTISALNEGASLAALGISESQAQQLATSVNTVGDFLTVVRGQLLRNGAKVRRLLATEQPRVWAVVIAGNQPEGDVAALTRGGFSYADIDRLVTSTEANIVKKLKKEPDTLGILGTVLDAKILYIDMLTALAVAREFADDALRNAMKAEGMSVRKEPKAFERLRNSELGLIISGQTLGTRKPGSKPGNNTLEAFNGLASIARQNDGLLNRAFGEALVQSGLADSYQIERVLGTESKYYSDIYIARGTERIRIEVMWRTSAGRADIANYVLLKLGNYARAIGLLK